MECITGDPGRKLAHSLTGKAFGTPEDSLKEVEHSMSIRFPLTITAPFTKGALAAMVVTGLQIAAPVAHALPTPAQLPLPMESTRLAVHLPTGCIAKLVTNEGRFVKAQIVDEDCLPEGSAPRDVPGALYDFSKDREYGVPGWKP